MQVAEPHIANALGLCIHDLLGNDGRLFVTGTGPLQRISAKRFNLIEGEYRHGGLLDSPLIVSKTHVACRKARFSGAKPIRLVAPRPTVEQHLRGNESAAKI